MDQVIRFEKDQFIYLPTSRVEALYIVKSGKVLVFKEANKRIIPQKLAVHKHFLGEEIVFLGPDRQWGSYALTFEPTELIPIKNEDLSDFFGEAPKWLKDLIELLGNRLAKTVDVISEHKIKDPEICDGYELTDEEEIRIKKLIKDA